MLYTSVYELYCSVLKLLKILSVYVKRQSIGSAAFSLKTIGLKLEDPNSTCFVLERFLNPEILFCVVLICRDTKTLR